MEQITTSKQFRINWRDAGKGCIVAALTAGLTAVYTALTDVPVHTIDWKVVGIAAATAGVGYIIKNWLTPSQTVIKNTPPKS